MKVQVRYFAALRERLGSAETVAIAVGSTVGGLRDALIARGDAYAQALSRDRLLRCSLQQRMCDESQLLVDGAEVAFFPPVTGG